MEGDNVMDGIGGDFLDNDFDVDALSFGEILENTDNDVNSILNSTESSAESIEVSEYGNMEIESLVVSLKLKKKIIKMYFTNDEKVANDFYKKSFSQKKFEQQMPLYILPWGLAVINSNLLNILTARSESPVKVTIKASDIEKEVNDNLFEYTMLMEHLTELE